MLSCSKLKITMFVIAALGYSSAEAATKVAVTYTFVEVEVSPFNRTHRDTYTKEYVLQGHSISSNGGSGEIGKAHVVENTHGTYYVSKADIKPNNSIEITTIYLTYKIVTNITSNGIDQCSARRKVVRRPGHSLLEDIRESNGEYIYMSDIHFENVTCAIVSE